MTLWKLWIWPIASGKTRRPALPIALVVGSLLLAVNQGAQVIAGDIDLALILRAAANYAIPYVVSSVGYLNAPNGPQTAPAKEVQQR